MIEYSNPQPPEGINASERSPLGELAWLLALVAAFVLAAVALLGVSADRLAGLIPFELERDAAARFFDSPGEEPEEAYLNDLAGRLARHLEVPAGMRFTVHFRNEGTVNAFATLGGHIMIDAGLLRELDSENALAMVLAHEMAHVVERHPIRSLGRGVIIGVFLASLTGTGTDVVAGRIVNDAGAIAALSFSRAQERAADDVALDVLLAEYGHLEGAADLFRLLAARRGPSPPEFLSTHPLTDERLEHLETVAARHGSGTLTPLPPALRGAGASS